MKDNGRYEIEFSEQKRIAFVTVYERIDFEQLFNAMNTLAADPRFDGSYKALIDMTKMDFHPSFDQFNKMFSDFQKMKDVFSNKVALVMVGVVKSIGDLAVKLTKNSGMKLGCFYSLVKAEEWLLED